MIRTVLVVRVADSYRVFCWFWNKAMFGFEFGCKTGLHKKFARQDGLYKFFACFKSTARFGLICQNPSKYPCLTAKL